MLYVIIAVLVGTFFVASVYFADGAESWGREGRWAAGFLQVYRLALLIGCAMQIVAAVLLRWLTRVSGMNRLAHWIVCGAAIGFALPWIFARLGYVLEERVLPDRVADREVSCHVPTDGGHDVRSSLGLGAGRSRRRDGWDAAVDDSASRSER